MNALEVTNLSFSYQDGETVLDNVSFSIEKGSYVTVIGHNGSGKSTLARILVKLLKPKKGIISIFGKNIYEDEASDFRKKCSIVFQNPDNQFIGATVEDDIAFGLENLRIPHDKMGEIVLTYAKKVGMELFLNKEPSNLSGGQKQRVAIAGVLAMNPDILILDEATAMLDPKGKNEIISLIHEMRKENPDLTIISITHDIEEANLSDKVIVLNRSEIAYIGSPKDLFSNSKLVSEYDLSYPFIYQLKNSLEKEGIKVDVESMKGFVEKLWLSK